MDREVDARIAIELYEELTRLGLIEDRLEYSKEDFITSYPSLSIRSINYLIALVRSNGVVKTFIDEYIKAKKS